MDLIEREVGQFPVSMGTSLAIEGFLGIHPNQTKPPLDVKTVKEIWINLRTLARNLWNSIKTERLNVIDPAQAVMVLLQEVQTIPVVLQQAGVKVKVQYYIASMDQVRWTFPHAIFKKAKTPKQMAYEVYERYVAITLYKQMVEEGIPVMEIKKLPPKTDGTVALLTHYPSELFWKDQFSRLFLLESNTGKLKPWNMWYTKLNNVKEDTPLPFDKFTLQVFGDGVLIEPQPRGIKAQLKTLAEARRWSPITKPDKIHYDIGTYGTKELKEAYATLR